MLFNFAEINISVKPDALERKDGNPPKISGSARSRNLKSEFSLVVHLHKIQGVFFEKAYLYIKKSKIKKLDVHQAPIYVTGAWN